MVKINLREYYPQYYIKDVYILVEDDVAEAFEESKRKAKAEEMESYRHRDYRSFDCNSSLETRISKSDYISPLAELEERYMSKKLYEALSTLTQEQQRRIYAKYFLGLSNTDIAKAEKCDESAIRKSIKRSIAQLKKFFEEN